MKEREKPKFTPLSQNELVELAEEGQELIISLSNFVIESGDSKLREAFGVNLGTRVRELQGATNSLLVVAGIIKPEEIIKSVEREVLAIRGTGPSGRFGSSELPFSKAKVGEFYVKGNYNLQGFIRLPDEMVLNLMNKTELVIDGMDQSYGFRHLDGMSRLGEHALDGKLGEYYGIKRGFQVSRGEIHPSLIWQVGLGTGRNLLYSQILHGHDNRIRQIDLD